MPGAQGEAKERQIWGLMAIIACTRVRKKRRVKVAAMDREQAFSEGMKMRNENSGKLKLLEEALK